MRTIYKYQLILDNNQEVLTHKFCQFLSMQVQNGIPCLWLIVDTEQPKQKLNVNMFGTGHNIPDSFYVGADNNLFAGTFQYESLVFHVFINGILTI